jgi:iron(III) transport system substrate-binding protein
MVRRDLTARRLLVLCLMVTGCRIESVSPATTGPISTSDTPSGDVWVYTSMYRPVVDALEPVLKEQLPAVTVHWYQAGSEKVLARLEAELAAGGTQADVIATSDPFLYARFKEEGRWLPYASPNGQRIPRSLVDLDAQYEAIRVSTMVLVHRKEARAPSSFRELTDPKWAGEVALGDPLTSGTAFTWAVFMEQAYGAEFFAELRTNGARIAGGNAAVLQKLEGGEAKVGVLLLENALVARAKGSPVEIAWPSDGAVVIPGYAAILKTSRHSRAAQAVVDVLLSAKGQAVIVGGDMHAADPRLNGPRGEAGVEALIVKARPWDEAMQRRGNSDGNRVKQLFSRAFSK